VRAHATSQLIKTSTHTSARSTTSVWLIVASLIHRDAGEKSSSTANGPPYGGSTLDTHTVLLKATF
jgi:hypothetical protein